MGGSGGVVFSSSSSGADESRECRGAVSIVDGDACRKSASAALTSATSAVVSGARAGRDCHCLRAATASEVTMGQIEGEMMWSWEGGAAKDDDDELLRPPSTPPIDCCRPITPACDDGTNMIMFATIIYERYRFE
jgi:hypothetical protein